MTTVTIKGNVFDYTEDSKGNATLFINGVKQGEDIAEGFTDTWNAFHYWVSDDNGKRLVLNEDEFLKSFGITTDCEIIFNGKTQKITRQAIKQALKQKGYNMTNKLINAQVLTFKELSQSQKNKLINDFNKNNQESWEAFCDFNSDIECILKDYPQYLKIFEFCKEKTSFCISFSQGDYANIGIKTFNLKQWLKTLIKCTDYGKLAQSLLRCDLALQQIEDNIKIIKKEYTYDLSFDGYYIEDKYLEKYKDIIDFVFIYIKESIETINRLVYSYLSNSYLSCCDYDYAIQELSNYKFTVVNDIIVSQDYI